MSPIPTDHDKARETVARLLDHAPHVEGWEDGDGNDVPFAADLRAAADLITAQAEENRRLREALRGMVGLYDSDEGTRSLPEVSAARAALSSTGEK